MPYAYQGGSFCYGGDGGSLGQAGGSGVVVANSQGQSTWGGGLPGPAITYPYGGISTAINNLGGNIYGSY
jgi:hypothetical protein